MGKRIQGGFVLKIIVVTIIAIIFAIVIFIFMWKDGLFLDKWEKKIVSYDLDGDKIIETISLNNRKMTVMHNNEVVWESQKEWKVVDFLIGDINRDEAQEILLLVWKRGNYGEYTPFWDENDDEFTQHIFIFQWKDNRLDPIWMSSKLKPQVKEWSLTDENLINILTEAGEETVWMWRSWGLERWK